MAGSATLTMNRSRLASTAPAQTIARTWLGFVPLTRTSATSMADLKLTLRTPYALGDQSRPVPHLRSNKIISCHLTSNSSYLPFRCQMSSNLLSLRYNSRQPAEATSHARAVLNGPIPHLHDRPLR